MTRDDLIRELNSKRGNWPALAFVYFALIGTMVGTALAII